MSHSYYFRDPPTIVNFEITGISSLHNNAFVVISGSRKIRIFQLSNFAQLKYIEMPIFSNLSGIVGCEKNHCLYVADCNNNCVWKVIKSPSGTERDIETSGLTRVQFVAENNPWICNIVNPVGLSITTAGWLVVVTRLTDNLYLYLPDGTLSVYLSLSKYEIQSPRQAVLAPDGSFIICCDENLPKQQGIVRLLPSGDKKVSSMLLHI